MAQRGRGWIPGLAIMYGLSFRALQFSLLPKFQYHSGSRVADLSVITTVKCYPGLTVIYSRDKLKKYFKTQKRPVCEDLD